LTRTRRIDTPAISGPSGPSSPEREHIGAHQQRDCRYPQCHAEPLQGVQQVATRTHHQCRPVTGHHSRLVFRQADNVWHQGLVKDLSGSGDVQPAKAHGPHLPFYLDDSIGGSRYVQLADQSLRTCYRRYGGLTVIPRRYPATTDQHVPSGAQPHGSDQVETGRPLQELKGHQEGGLIPVTPGERHTEILEFPLLICGEGGGDWRQAFQRDRWLQLARLHGILQRALLRGPAKLPQPQIDQGRNHQAHAEGDPPMDPYLQGTNCEQSAHRHAPYSSYICRWLRRKHTVGTRASHEKQNGSMISH